MNGLFGSLLGGLCKGIVSTWHLAKKDHPAIYRMMCAGLVVYGIVLTLSFCNGSYWIAGDQWNGFLQQPNWAGFALFFPLLGLLTISNWKSFENAWRRLPEKGVLQEMTFSGTQPLSSNGIQAIIDHLYGLRRRWVWVALVIGLVLTMVDSTCTMTFHYPSLYNCLPAYFKAECARKIDDKNQSKFIRKCISSDGTGNGCGTRLVAEKDFMIFHLGFGCKETNVKSMCLPGAEAAGYMLVLVAYLMQGLLIAMGFMLLFQILVNLHAFSFLALFPFRHVDARGIRLNFRDEMGEFGLADWNNAMNYTNLIIAVGMLIPVISATSQPEARDDVGQILFMLFLPILLFVPILWSFITRAVLQLRFKRNFQRLSASEKDSYKAQVLWPFDRDMISKVAIGILIIEYLYVASELPENVKDILGFLFK